MQTGKPNTLDYILSALPAAVLALPLTAWNKIRNTLVGLKQDPVLPLAMLAWLFLILEALVWRITSGARVSLEEAGPDNYVRVTFLAIAAVLIFYIGALSKFRWLVVFSRPPMLWFGLLTVLFGLSLLWSQYPVLTAFKVAEYIVNISLIAVLAYFIAQSAKRWQITKTIFDLHWIFLALQLFSVFLGVFVWPEYAIYRGSGTGLLGFQIQGVLPDIPSNTVGELSAILLLVVLVRLLVGWARPKWFYSAMGAFFFIVLILAQSRSPILGLVLGLVLVLWLQRRFGWMLIGMASTLFLLLGSLSSTVTAYLARGQENTGNIANLSGRTVWWSAALESLQGHFLTGFGAYAGSRYIFREIFDNSETASLHNSYMEVLAGVGIFGVLFLVIGVLQTWARVLAKPRTSPDNQALANLLWMEAVAVMAVQSIRSIFSATFVYVDFLTFGLILIFIFVKQQSLQSKSQP